MTIIRTMNAVMAVTHGCRSVQARVSAVLIILRPATRLYDWLGLVVPGHEAETYPRGPSPLWHSSGTNVRGTASRGRSGRAAAMPRKSRRRWCRRRAGGGPSGSCIWRVETYAPEYRGLVRCVSESVSAFCAHVHFAGSATHRQATRCVDGDRLDRRAARTTVASAGSGNRSHAPDPVRLELQAHHEVDRVGSNRRDRVRSGSRYRPHGCETRTSPLTELRRVEVRSGGPPYREEREAGTVAGVGG
jgi:hypothetical protein